MAFCTRDTAMAACWSLLHACLQGGTFGSDAMPSVGEHPSNSDEHLDNLQHKKPLRRLADHMEVCDRMDRQ